eukprot:gene11989-biopygen4898
MPWCSGTSQKTAVGRVRQTREHDALRAACGERRLRHRNAFSIADSLFAAPAAPRLFSIFYNSLETCLCGAERRRAAQEHVSASQRHVPVMQNDAERHRTAQEHVPTCSCDAELRRNMFQHTAHTGQKVALSQYKRQPLAQGGTCGAVVFSFFGHFARSSMHRHGIHRRLRSRIHSSYFPARSGA